MNNYLLEDIHGTDIDQHYREYTEEETKQYIQNLKIANSRRFRSNYLRALFDALYRGVDAKKVFFAECIASELKAKLQYMAGSILLPFSGIRGVGPLVDWLYQKTVTNTALEATHRMGVYISNKDKLFVFVGRNKEMWEDDHVFAILLHEMCHMYASNHITDYKRIFYDKYILPFYIQFFNTLNNVLDINMDSDSLKIYAKEYADLLIYSEPKKRCVGLNKFLNKLYKENADMANVIYSLWVDVLEKNDPETIRFLNKVFLYSYHKAGIKIPDVFNMYQELVTPSEIVSVASLIHNKRPEYLEMLNNMFR